MQEFDKYFNSLYTVQQIIAPIFGMKGWRYFKTHANLQREKIVMWEWLFPKREANICSLTTQNGGRLLRCLLLLDQLRLVTLYSWYILCSFHVQPITYTMIGIMCSLFSIFIFNFLMIKVNPVSGSFSLFLITNYNYQTLCT